MTLREESRALQAALELAETQEKQKNDTIFRYTSPDTRPERIGNWNYSFVIAVASPAPLKRRSTRWKSAQIRKVPVSEPGRERTPPACTSIGRSRIPDCARGIGFVYYFLLLE